MKSIKIILILFLSISILQCCKEEPETPPTEYGNLKVTYSITNQGIPVSLGDKFSFDGLNEFMLEKFKFHLAHLEVKSGSAVTNINSVAIIDFEIPELTSFVYSVPVGSYSEIGFGYGLDEAQNASDPASFDIDHPLSAAQGMYWSWAMKYRFVIVEGRANELDVIGTPSDIIMAYHPGADEFYKRYSQPLQFSVAKGDTTELMISIELNTIYTMGSGGNIDIPTEYQTHTTPDDYKLAEKFSTNFGEAITFTLK